MPPKKVPRFDMLSALDENAEKPEKGPCQKQLAPPTIRLRETLWKAWQTSVVTPSRLTHLADETQRFLEEIQSEYQDHHLFRDGTQNATESRLRVFFHWYAVSYTRDVKDPPTVESMEQYVWVFGKTNNERSSYQISSDVVDSLKKVFFCLENLFGLLTPQVCQNRIGREGWTARQAQAKENGNIERCSHSPSPHVEGRVALVPEREISSPAVAVYETYGVFSLSAWGDRGV